MALIAGPDRQAHVKVLKRKRGNAGGKPKEGKILPVEQLPWKEVPFPERFDDAEGFFGLEEISDVEVERDESSRQVGYKVKSKNVSDEGEPRKAMKQRLGGVQKPRVHKAAEDDDEEWAGFQEIESELQVSREKPITKSSSHPSMPSPFGALEHLDDDANGADVSAWYVLRLSEETLSSLSRLKFPNPTPIQQAAIPHIMDGHDLIGKASTGSGKTLAFAIPVYERFLERMKSPKHAHGEKKVSPLAMIVAPTRELAHQLSEHIANLSGTATAMSLVTLTGGLSMQKQQRLLPGADIIIGTPGRVWEMMSQSSDLVRALQDLDFLILDEADRLLSEGHFKELSEILDALQPKGKEEGEEGVNAKSQRSNHHRQTLVFSATFQKDLQTKLAGRSKHRELTALNQQESMDYLLQKLSFRESKPKYIDVNPASQMADKLNEGILECAALEKDLYLYSLLLHQIKQRTLVFVNSISSVRRLTPFLQNLNLPAFALHSQMPQKARLRSIERFSSPSSPSSTLIATDVAARGLDIPSVHSIIHYHVPRAADAYVHRSGRTARAENSGSSILLCSPEETQGVQRLVAKVHARNTAKDLKTHYLKTIELDGRTISRLKTRANLSKKIADASLAKEKHHSEDSWLKSAAEDLGVDYDSEEFAAEAVTQKGKGRGRKDKQQKARGVTKDETSAWKTQLKQELKDRVNLGVSEKYLTAGGIDIKALLAEKEQGQFLGEVQDQLR